MHKVDLIVALFPLVLLIGLMTKKRALPSWKALPLAAGVLAACKLAYFKTGAVVAAATIINGVLTALTPITVVWGAILLFKSMEHSGAMRTLREWLNGITTNRVAQVMIVAWAFSFLIEGASGFGAPVVIAAPILAGLGFDPLATVVVCLVFNSVPVTFGVVGVPTWFGLGELGLTSGEIVRIGFESAIVNSIAALVVVPAGLLFIVPGREVRKNAGFIAVSIIACVAPYLALASINYEFPSIVGGFVGTITAIVLARRGIGLAKSDIEATTKTAEVSTGELVKASFGLWGTVLILLVTRMDRLGIKAVLTSAAHSVSIDLGRIGTLSVSPSLVVSLKSILSTQTAWTHNLLYVPSFVPFFVVAGLLFWILHTPANDIKAAWSESIHRMRHPVMALVGTLVFAKLLMQGGERSCTMIIGTALANAAGSQWYYFSSLLGALGSFFAGSNTVSNLTFAPIQASIAQTLGLDRFAVLTMQSVGGAMGKMVCIHDIVAACSVLGITGLEGYIMKRTIIPMLLYAAVAAGAVVLLLAIF